MQIEFDPVKNVLNFHKHGLPLSDAARLEWAAAVIRRDTRQDYGEARMVGFAYIELRLHCVVFVDRGEVRRIISLRKAKPKEEQLYAQAQTGPHQPHGTGGGADSGRD